MGDVEPIAGAADIGKHARHEIAGLRIPQAGHRFGAVIGMGPEPHIFADPAPE